MRKLLVVLVIVLSGMPAGAAPAPGFASDNVEFIANIPDTAMIGGRIVGNLLYVTLSDGLRIYDISLGVPVPVGALALPHFENEDVDTDGRLLLIGSDYFVAPRGTHNVIVVDVSIPQAPIVRSVIPNLYRAHTVTCVGRNASGARTCDYAWTAGGDVLDLRNPSAPVKITRNDTYYGHDTNVDDAGFAWTGYDGKVFDVSSPTSNRANLPVLATGDFGAHNSMRPNAKLATPALLADTKIDPGELVIGTDEAWLSLQNNLCRADGPFKTSWFHTVNGAYVITPLHTFRMGQGTLPDAKPLGATCSSHWFDESGGVVADAWYEQGVRFLDVSSYFDPARPDAITQIGYYMPLRNQAWQALYRDVTEGPLPGKYVYVFDYERGLDILRFTGQAGDPQVLAPTVNVSAPIVSSDPRVGFACRVR